MKAIRPRAKTHPVGAKAIPVSAFCKRYALKRDWLPRLTGFSHRAVANWAQGQAPSAPAVKQFTELERLFAALARLFTARSVGTWLKTPNEAFDGSTPLQVIERGENDRIWRMIYQVQTGEPI